VRCSARSPSSSPLPRCRPAAVVPHYTVHPMLLDNSWINHSLVCARIPTHRHGHACAPITICDMLEEDNLAQSAERPSLSTGQRSRQFVSATAAAKCHCPREPAARVGEHAVLRMLSLWRRAEACPRSAPALSPWRALAAALRRVHQAVPL